MSLATPIIDKLLDERDQLRADLAVCIEALNKLKSQKYQTIIMETKSGDAAFNFLPGQCSWDIASEALAKVKHAQEK